MPSMRAASSSDFGDLPEKRSQHVNAVGTRRTRQDQTCIRIQNAEVEFLLIQRNHNDLKRHHHGQQKMRGPLPFSRLPGGISFYNSFFLIYSSIRICDKNSFLFSIAMRTRVHF